LPLWHFEVDDKKAGDVLAHINHKITDLAALLRWRWASEIERPALAACRHHCPSKATLDDMKPVGGAAPHRSAGHTLARSSCTLQSRRRWLDHSHR
jgi:hypothetical protein